ncbi:FRG domain-containing protein [Herbaspirillum sp. RV1423]|uniref:FRG domain-containing protein n=1 Tax=Herbaspirillum sp. RV1423 TaxID=1443993 RepID=UPI0004B2A5D2|nr:FRG domain-containing protein [Herbaspirillum sp. RV1423]
MFGQWTGHYQDGENKGQAILNLDDCDTHYKGVMFLNTFSSEHPGLQINVEFKKPVPKQFRFTITKANYFPLNENTGLGYNSWPEYEQKKPNKTWPETIVIDAKRSSASLTFQWKTNTAQTGTIRLDAPRKGNSTLDSSKLTWDEFKARVHKLETRRYIFRGQNQTWRLRTSFHRTHRANLFTFMSEDIQILHRTLSGRTKHIFNLEVPQQNGAFFNMLQHHGYPTPILDWTHSPYVAAFFAFRTISSEESKKAKNKDKHVRIFVFDRKNWVTDIPQVMLLNISLEHFSVSEFMALNNDRVIPQQGIATITNIDDIEKYIERTEQHRAKKYLQAVDLPWSARDKVMTELSLMGITAGSLFPGIDGTCEEMRERHFRI